MEQVEHCRPGHQDGLSDQPEAVPASVFPPLPGEVVPGTHSAFPQVHRPILMRTKGLVILTILVLFAGTAGTQTKANGIVDHPCAAEPTVKQAGGWGPRQVWLYAHDFGQLCYYREKNAALGPHVPRVIFMGDSITEIWQEKDPRFFAPGRIDRGISGQTTPQMLVRFRQDVIDLHPAVVHIMAGTNDIAGNTDASTLDTVEGNLASMADLARAHGIHVILASVLPTDRFPWQPDIDPAPVIVRLNSWIKRYAAQNGFTYVDYFDAMATRSGAMKPGLSSDGVHPTARGFAIMDPLARAAIRTALKRQGY
ncbi:MAG: SGNH/GDSL hydrolase family protein [Rhodanobacter sp.]